VGSANQDAPPDPAGEGEWTFPKMDSNLPAATASLQEIIKEEQETEDSEEEEEEEDDGEDGDDNLEDLDSAKDGSSQEGLDAPSPGLGLREDGRAPFPTEDPPPTSKCSPQEYEILKVREKITEFLHTHTHTHPRPKRKRKRFTFKLISLTWLTMGCVGPEIGESVSVTIERRKQSRNAFLSPLPLGLSVECWT